MLIQDWDRPALLTPLPDGDTGSPGLLRRCMGFQAGLVQIKQRGGSCATCSGQHGAQEIGDALAKKTGTGLSVKGSVGHICQA